MKKIFVVLMMMFMFGAVQKAQAFKPLELGGYKLENSGWTHIKWVEKARNPDLSSLRLQSELKNKEEFKNFRLFSDIEFANFENKDSNWLRQFWLSSQVFDDTKIRFGRIATAISDITPDVNLLRTVEETHLASVLGPYNYGLQIEMSPIDLFNQDWYLKADFGGNSASAFDAKNSEVFHHLEYSFRAKSCQNCKDFFAFGAQGGEDFLRFAIDFRRNIVSKLSARGVAYQVFGFEDGSSKFGGSLMGIYNPINGFELHTQIEGGFGEEYWTNGIRYHFSPRVELTIDYIVPSSLREDEVLARFELLF
jgi:hypothetical protein